MQGQKQAAIILKQKSEIEELHILIANQALQIKKLTEEIEALRLSIKIKTTDK